jgi:hypothetical protein
MGIAYNTSIVRDGLVLHLDAANPKSYPGSGTVWKDLSGNGNNGTLVNGVGYNSDNKGSMVFDGINDYAEISDFNLGNTFTFSCWINTNTTQTAMLFIRGNNANNKGVYLSMSSNDPGYLRAGGNNSNGWNSGRISNEIINDSKWHYVVGIFNQSNNTILGYVDGKVGSTLNSTFNSNDYTPKNTKIGRNQISNIQFYQGSVSSYFIYNRALTAAEIRQNFEATRGRYEI